MKKIVIVLFLFHLFSFSQTVNKEKIAQSLDNYYELERENIHLHLNKNVFLTNETIWFKGYIIDKKTNSLSFKTTNVYVSIYNSEKKQISNNLFFASNGVIDGQLKLPKNLDSGIYYLQTYTNFMNNFEEDESSYHEIEIINSENINSSKTYDKKNISISIKYEGGNLIIDSNNNVVVKIKDCLNNGVKIENINVLDEKQNIITVFSTNNLGYGKFILPNTKKEFYHLEGIYEGVKFSKKLDEPLTDTFNLILEKNEDKTYTFEIRSNASTLKKYENEELFLLIQKDRATRFITFKIQKNNILKFTLDGKNFFSGLNTLRLIDKNLNQISERLLYKKEETNSIFEKFEKKITNDSVKISGKLSSKELNLSASVIPKSNKQNHFKNSIFKTLHFDNYISEKIDSELLNPNSNEKDLDLFLVSSTSKYKWTSILNKTPNANNEFEVGIDLSIKINSKNSSKLPNQLKIFTTNGINELATLNENSEYLFKNILALDSLAIHYKFPEKPDLANKTNAFYTLSKNKSKFKKIDDTTFSICKIAYEESKNNNLTGSEKEKVTELNSVEIVKNTKPKLLYTNFPSTRSAKAYKITEVVADTYKDVLSFIASHEYDVQVENGRTLILTRNKRSFLGNRYPVVLLDNTRVDNVNDLINLRLVNVEEIYINNKGAGMGNDGMNGIISIFTKKSPTFNPLPDSSKKSNFFYITNGFTNILSFTNSEELLLQPNLIFKEFGTHDFLRNIDCTTDGAFEFTVPIYNQKEMILNFQGIDSKGQLYEQNIELKL